MKIAAILLTVLALAGTALFFHENKLESRNDVYEMYQAWKIKFNQNTNGSEDAYRFKVFSENYKKVTEINASQSSYVLGVENQFAALTNEEFRAIYSNKALRDSQPHIDNSNSIPINVGASNIDWVSAGAVYAIQNQAQCGSCWAFSAVSQVESWYKISGNDLINFSEQQVVSCDTSSYGCNGGYPDKAFVYTASKGMETAADYPYTSGGGVTGQCLYDASKATMGVNKSYSNVTPQNPAALLTALGKQPISILVDGGCFTFQTYKSGIIDGNCPAQLDHAISLTGYTSGTTDYWTVRNSWGTTWGQAGYADIAYSTGPGICGINSSPSYPTG